MSVLIFVILVLVVVGIICAIAYNIPWPPPMGFMRWVIPCVALLIALVLILPKLGVS